MRVQYTVFVAADSFDPMKLSEAIGQLVETFVFDGQQSGTHSIEFELPDAE